MLVAGLVDIAAVESQTLDLAVTVFTDEVDGDTSPADLSLREAIILANSNAASDIIRLPAGVFTLSIEGVDEDESLTGDLDIFDSIGSTRIVGAGVGKTIIDAGGIDRVFHFWGEGVVGIVEGVTIRGGRTTGEGGGIVLASGNNISLTIVDSEFVGNEATLGGGISTGEGNNLTVFGSTFRNNTASSLGGAIFNDEGSATISDTKILNNSAGQHGGGVYNDGPLLTFRDGRIAGNTAGEFGGGIHNEWSLSVSNSTIEDNRATDGGGIASRSGRTTINNSQILGNIASGSGGGVLNQTNNRDDTYSPLTVIDSVIERNEAGENGGGINYNVDEGNLIVSNTIVRANHADGLGGGIYFGNEIATISDSIVSNNSADSDGGGIAVWDGDMEIHRTVIADNTSGGVGGGAYASDDLDLFDSWVRGNAAQGDGGGLYFEAGAKIASSMIAGNSSFGRGGGIMIQANFLSMSQSSVENNYAEETGGGLEFTGVGQSYIEFSTIAANRSGTSGGGIHLRGDGAPGSLSLEISTSSISGNQAIITGGGVHVSNDAANLVVRSTTISDNAILTGLQYTRQLGAGVAVDATNATFYNSIIASNFIQFGDLYQRADDIGGSVRPESSYNLFGVVASWAGVADGENGNLVGRTPGLAPLAYNGGPTKTHALLPGSPAIDAGDGGFDPNAFDPPLLTDQRGRPRIADGDGDATARLDMGAVEYSPDFLFADLNEDGRVGLLDLARLRRSFLSDVLVGYTEGDLTADGRADRTDLAAMSGALGTSVSPAAGSAAPAAAVDRVPVSIDRLGGSVIAADRLAIKRKAAAVNVDRSAIDRIVFQPERLFSIASRSHRGLRWINREFLVPRQVTKPAMTP